MKPNLKILNKKEIKPILNMIKQQWDVDFESDYGFLKNDKDKVFIINKEFANIDTDNLRINSLGMYFGTINRNEIRLSIEGSQLIGPKAKKNVITLTDTEIKDWLHGDDIKTKEENKEFVLIRNKSDFYGTGKIKENFILNFIPKGRRLK